MFFEKVVCEVIAKNCCILVLTAKTLECTNSKNYEMISSCFTLGTICEYKITLRYFIIAINPNIFRFTCPEKIDNSSVKFSYFALACRLLNHKLCPSCGSRQLWLLEGLVIWNLPSEGDNPVLFSFISNPCKVSTTVSTVVSCCVPIDRFLHKLVATSSIFCVSTWTAWKAETAICKLKCEI